MDHVVQQESVCVCRGPLSSGGVGGSCHSSEDLISPELISLDLISPELISPELHSHCTEIQHVSPND